MTKTVQEMISVMQAYAAGKEIQYQSFIDGEWHSVVGSPIWNWNNYDYRVKPEAVRYRRFIWKNCLGEYVMGIANDLEGLTVNHAVPAPVRNGEFVRWVDTDWLETEV